MIIKPSLLFFSFLLLSGCLKKIEEVDHINTNIFDREYAGEQWFEIVETYFYTNALGQNKARVELKIPVEKVPELRPSNIQVLADGDGIDPFILNFPLTTGGDFETVLDLPYDGMIEYCFSLGIYVESEDAAINTFEDCFTL